MTDVCKTIRLPAMALPPVNRGRLAHYLELPSAAQIDPVTDAEIRKLDARHDELLSSWQSAAVAAIENVHGRWIELKCDTTAHIEATIAYGKRLLDHGADALIVAGFTIGQRIDEIIKHHLDREEIFEAFILKQWAATMTEQARVQLTRSLRAWAAGNGRSLLPFDGPGYNGWPLTSLKELLELLYDLAEPSVAPPLRATDSGVLLPTNSMLIVYGVTCGDDSLARFDERLAQCHRCAMPDCRYRSGGFAATPDVVA